MHRIHINIHRSTDNSSTSPCWWCHIFIKSLYIYVYIYNVYGATSPATPFISFYILYGGPFTLGVVIGCSIVYFFFLRLHELYIKGRPGCVVYTQQTISHVLIRRVAGERKREKGLGLVFGILWGFLDVYHARFDKYNHALYIYKKERERRDSYFSSLLISIRFYFSMSCLKRVCCLSYLEIERKRRKNKEELETCCRVSEHISERDVCCPYPRSFPVQFVNPTNL